MLTVIRLQYNCLRIALFGYLQAYRAPDPEYGEGLDPAYLRHAQRICTNAANDIAYLVRIHIQLYGQYMPTVVCLASMMSVFTLMEDLSSLMSRSNCIDMVRILRQATKVFPVARGMMRMVLPTAARLGIALPSEVRSLASEFDRTDWQQGDEKSFGSVLPNYALRRKFGVRDQYMGELLTQWNSFAI